MVTVNKRWAVFAGLCLLWAGFAEGAKAAYVLTDLGPVEAKSINNSGWVTGRNSDGNAFIYVPGIGMKDIGILGGHYGSLGLSINTFGQVTGIINTAINGSSYSNSASAFIYTPGSGMTLLDPWTYGYGINDLGQVSGWRGNDSAFIYTPGTGFESIEMLGQYSSIVSINNLGQGTGGSTNIVVDSKRDRIEIRKRFRELLGEYAHDETLLALLRSYEGAVNDPQNELIHLYEIRDALSEKFDNDATKARTSLGISYKHWSRLGRLCNDEPLTQGRHRGKQPETCFEMLA